MSGKTAPQSLLTTVLRATATIMAGNSFSKACLLGLEFYLAAVLGSDLYGLFSVGLGLILIAASIAMFGMNFGVVQFLAKYGDEQRGDKQAQVVRVGVIVVVVVSALIGAWIYGNAEFLATRVFSKPQLAGALALAGLIIPFESVNQVLAASFRGLRMFRHHVVTADLIRNLVLIGGMPVVAARGMSLEALFQVFLVGSVAGTIYGVVVLFGKLERAGISLDRVVAGELLRFSYPLFLWNVLQKSSNRVFVLVAGVFLTSATTGVLAAGMRFVVLLSFLQTAVNMAAPVEFATLFHRDDASGLNRLFRTLAQVLLAASVLVALPMIANPYVAMGLIGSSYAALGWVLWPLVGTKVFNVGTGPVGQLLISCHRRQAMLSLTVVDVILQFAVVVPLAALYGVVGIVFAESGRLAGMVVLRHLVAYRLLSVHLLTRRYVQLFALSAGALVGSGVLAASVGGLRGYLIAVVTCGALYAALVTVLVRPRLRGLAGLRGGAGRADGAAP